MYNCDTFFKDLSYNNLGEIPAGMGFLVRLITLNLSHNTITELPPDVTSMRCKFRDTKYKINLIEEIIHIFTYNYFVTMIIYDMILM